LPTDGNARPQLTPRMTNTAKLTNEQRVYVVMRLAGYDLPSAIARGPEREFCDRHQAEVRVRWLDQMARSEMAVDNSAEARALLKQVAEEMSEGARHKHDHHGVFLHGGLSDAELDARIAALAAELGLAVVPLGTQAAAGGEDAADEPQSPAKPLSG